MNDENSKDSREWPMLYAIDINTDGNKLDSKNSNQIQIRPQITSSI